MGVRHTFIRGAKAPWMPPEAADQRSGARGAGRRIHRCWPASRGCQPAACGQHHRTIDLERADRAIVVKSALPVRKRSRAGIKSARGVHSTGPGKAVCERARLAVLDERRSPAQRT